MKSLLILIICLGFNLLRAGEVRTEVKEYTLGKEKKEKIRIERIFRGKQLLVTSMVRNGKTSRIFNFTDDLSCVESDEDGDGFLEDFVIYNEKTRQIEAFRRSKDGGIKTDSTIAKKFKESLEATDTLISWIGSEKSKENKCNSKSH